MTVNGNLQKPDLKINLDTLKTEEERKLRASKVLKFFNGITFKEVANKEKRGDKAFFYHSTTEGYVNFYGKRANSLVARAKKIKDEEAVKKTADKSVTQAA